MANYSCYVPLYKFHFATPVLSFYIPILCSNDFKNEGQGHCKRSCRRPRSRVSLQCCSRFSTSRRFGICSASGNSKCEFNISSYLKFYISVSDTLKSSGPEFYLNFSNIRFGQAPVGLLRFSPPLAPEGRDVTVNNGQQGAICPQAGPSKPPFRL